ncbi:DUF6537 domain-containing protein [Streptomyces bobili]|uniref:DUF6537 domain-containing protein n=1 Tax=Streptomyces bobili TaxID=67280 RepID=UPI003664D7AA
MPVSRRSSARCPLLLPPAPAISRELGIQRRIRIGSRWGRPLLRGLYRLRRLRGTPFDVFGHTEVRRTERRLVEESPSSRCTRRPQC